MGNFYIDSKIHVPYLVTHVSSNGYLVLQTSLSASQGQGIQEILLEKTSLLFLVPPSQISIVSKLEIYQARLLPHLMPLHKCKAD